MAGTVQSERVILKERPGQIDDSEILLFLHTKDVN